MGKFQQTISLMVTLCLALALLLTPGVSAQAVTTVSIDVPGEVSDGSSFIAKVEIDNVIDFDACNYDVTYDDSVLEVTDVSNGSINGTTIPVDMWGGIAPGTIRVIENVPGASGVSGSGYLAEIHFHVIGSACNTSTIDLHDGVLADKNAQEISATWVDGSVHINTVLDASFSADITEAFVGQTITFADATSGGTPPYTYAWDFDDGGAVDSTAASPTHTYAAAGTYTVSLKVTDALGDSDIETKAGYITISSGVGGIINADTTWTAANSPYVVTASVMVSEGVTLTIEPGVTVKFESGKALQIDGCLIARGTDAEPIVFTSNQSSPAAGDWVNIVFTDTSVDATYDDVGNYISGSIMQYCTVEYGGGEKTPALKIVSSSPYIDRCIITNNASNGIYIDHGSPMITNNTISDNSGSGIYTYYAAMIISGNTITNNLATTNGGGIYAFGTITISSNIISNNSVSDDGGGGIYVATGTVTIMDNIIDNNSASNVDDGGGGIYINSGTVSISKNIISNNSALNVSYGGGGIYLGWTSTATITGNTITNNSAQKGGGIYTHQAMVTISTNEISGNSAIEGKGGGIRISGQSTVNYNNIHNNTPYDVYNSNTQGTPNVDATNNWWGTTVDAEIQERIWDWYDDASLGIVDYTPYRNYPVRLTGIGIAPAETLVVSENSFSVDIQLDSGDHQVDGAQAYVDFDPQYLQVDSITPGTALPEVLSNSYDNTNGTITYAAGAFSDLPTGTFTLATINFTALQENLEGTSVTFVFNEEAGRMTKVTWQGENFIIDQVVDGTVTISAVPPPVAAFTATPTEGLAPLTVEFTDEATGEITSWLWDFSDGSDPVEWTSETRPAGGVLAHTYTEMGVCTATLTVTGPGGSDSDTATITACGAKFTAQPISGAAPLSVQFTDQSVGATSWLWDFGDGETSTEQNPSHTYTQAGVYDVTLTVYGVWGADPDVETKADYISVGAILTGKVQLQGEAAVAHDLVVTLRLVGQESSTDHSVTTDAQGNFQIQNLTPGDYDMVAVDGPHVLRNVVARPDDPEKPAVALTAPETAVDFGELREGDVNDDGAVDNADYELLRASFGAMTGEGAYNDDANFDRNNIVDITDFSLLRRNFGEISDAW